MLRLHTAPLWGPNRSLPIQPQPKPGDFRCASLSRSFTQTPPPPPKGSKKWDPAIRAHRKSGYITRQNAISQVHLETSYQTGSCSSPFRKYMFMVLTAKARQVTPSPLTSDACTDGLSCDYQWITGYPVILKIINPVPQTLNPKP